MAKIQRITKNDHANTEEGFILDSRQAKILYDLIIASGGSIPGLNWGLVNEVLIGVVNNSNRVFHTSREYIPGTVSVYINGIREFNFTTSPTNTEIVLGFSPLNVLFTDQVSVQYISNNT